MGYVLDKSVYLYHVKGRNMSLYDLFVTTECKQDHLACGAGSNPDLFEKT